MSKLSEYISSNSEFRSSVNLYLSLNKKDKINSFIPTKSSVDILKKYLEAVENNKRQATLLLGPYGKGKSHLLLVLLAVLSLDRNDKENAGLIKGLVEKISQVDKDAAKSIRTAWKKGRFLPVIISGAYDDLSTPFLIGLTDALKRAGFDDLVPDTYYRHAVDYIARWKKEYPETYANFENILSQRGQNTKAIIKDLKAYNKESLSLFRELYSEITAGGVFNPLINSDILPIYKNIADKLKEEHGYSGIYIIFDEFSKFIEGQDKKSAGNNMKMLQDISELATDSKDSQVFITMVAHKGIKEYGRYLSKEIINSFTGIEGRIDEIQFVTSTKNNYELIKNAIIKDDRIFECEKVKKYLKSDYAVKAFELPAFKSTFNASDYENIVLKGCFPLSPAGAYLLLNVSEKVAQNERTLFTFISKEEQGSMAAYIKNHMDSCSWVINADLIYDYFKSLFKKSVANEYVHNEWLNAEYALGLSTDDSERKILKTLALINIVNKPSELTANVHTIALASGIQDAEAFIVELEDRGLIYKRATDNAYVFKTRATSDARNEISKRKAVRAGAVNYSEVLAEVSPLQYILPRKYNYKYSMTRYFTISYMEVNEFLGIENGDVFFGDSADADGRVMYLYKLDTNDYLADVEEHMKKLGAEKLVVVYSDEACTVTEALKSYDAIKDLKNDAKFFAKEENMILAGELPLVEDEIRSEILIYFENAFSDAAGTWTVRLVKGKLKKSGNTKLVDVVDELADTVFCKAIVVNNELINKKNITTAPIKKARHTIVDAIIRKDAEVLASFEHGTSAESTIYRALFVNNGIVGTELKKTSNERQFIEEIERFIESCGDKKVRLDRLVNVLTAEPYGVRSGVLAPYLAYCISKCEEDVIIYFSEKEVPVTADTIVSMCENPSDFSLYISLENAAKEAYLKKLEERFGVEEKNKEESRISEVYLAMQRWFRGLPQVTKNIRHQEEFFGNKELCKAFPEVKGILQAIDGNPYEAVFIELPKAFGTQDLKEVSSKMEMLFDKLSDYYEFLQSRIVDVTKEVLSGDKKQELRHCLRDWYEAQTESARNGLYSNTINDFMKLASSTVYMDDMLLAEKLSKIIIGVYFDSWNDKSLSEYESKLSELKKEIENIKDDGAGRSETLIFTSKSGKKIEQKYDLVDEGTGTILKNIISDALDDYSDIAVNDRVAILLEMIEKVLGKEK